MHLFVVYKAKSEGTIKPVFFVEGQAHPDQHLQNTLKLMIEANAWISISLKQHPTEGVEVDIKSANLGGGQINQILRYAVSATSGPPSSRN